MVADAIKRIQEAESEADRIERDARAKSKTLLADAHEAAERMLDEMRKQAWQEEKALKAEAAAKATVEAEALVVEGRSGVESVRSAGEKRVEDGVQRVLEAIKAAG